MWFNSKQREEPTSLDIRADECSPEELSRRASHTNDFVVTENTACRLLNPDINNMTVKGVELAGRFIHSGVSMRKDEPDSVRVAAVCENQKYNEYSNWSKAVYRIVQLGQGDFKISYGSIPYHDIFIRVKADADRPGFVESFRKARTVGICPFTQIKYVMIR